MYAMLAHKPGRVPVAANLNYTEDCRQIKPGEGEWTKISGLTAYRRDILKEGMLFDTSNLQTASKMMVSFPDKTQLGTREEMIKAASTYPAGLEDRQLC